jgi:hypothetical protein
MIVDLHEALDHRLKSGVRVKHEDIEAAVIEGAAHRLRPKLMKVSVVLASLIPILWETGVGADVMKPTAPHCWRHNYIYYPRADSRAGVLCPYERRGPKARDAKAKTGSGSKLRGRTAMKVRDG